MADLPTGTVTFLFTDIEGSTALWERDPEAMRSSLARHDALVRRAVEEHGGHVFKQMGDAVCAVFDVAPAAVAAALEAQGALTAERWAEPGPLRVRMALHSGTAHEHGGDYFGPALNRVSRLLAASHGGQVLLTQATEQLARGALPAGAELRDLGEHRLKDLVLSERVFQLVTAGLPADFPPLETLDSHPHNLPAQPTPLVGRARELTVAGEMLLRDDVRLLTLTGAGGSGKTRLALQLAADLAGSFEDGVYLVALAPISDAALVAPAIAQTLGVREAGAHPVLEVLKLSLQAKNMLLLLDNFEQVLAAAPVVAELLAACPKIKVLVTSRAVLHLRGEHLFLVPPLEVPDPTRLPPLEELMRYSAIRLLNQRAQAVRPDFALDADNAAAVANVCIRLDGLPLAIELAASRLKLLQPQAVLSRLGSRLGLLTGGARDLPARQQTLRNTIAWSYDLLEPTEKALFRRLAVFVGGATLEAAEAVCTAAGGLEADLLDGMASLMDKSLLRQQAPERGEGEARFVMLETIREFGLESLAASGEGTTVQRAHASFFLRLAEEAEPSYGGVERTVWLKRLAAEADNLRAALEWSRVEPDGARIELRLAGALSWFWYFSGRLTEGREALERALARTEDEARAGELAKALTGVGRLALVQGDYPAARSDLEEAVSTWREVGDRAGLAGALSSLGSTLVVSGDVKGGRVFLEEGLAIRSELGDRWGIAFLLFRLGEAAFMQRDYLEARGRLQESVGIFKELGDPWALALPLSYLGEVARCQGDYEGAAGLYEECLEVNRQLGNRWTTALCLHNLGHVALHRGEMPRATALFEEGLALARALGVQRGIALCLAGLAGVAARDGEAKVAARLFGAAEVLLESTGIAMNPADRGEYDSNVAAARARLEPEAFARAWAEGRAMPLERAIGDAVNPARD